MNSETHVLVGRTIEEVHIADDAKAIRFLTDQGEIIARADADCCSETWIEHVEIPALGIPAFVTSAKDVAMPEPDQGEDEYLQSYGFEISTDRGEILIEYRNASNGYYGGNLAWPGEHFYGGVYEQNVSSCNWVSLAGDHQACTAELEEARAVARRLLDI